MHIILFFRSFPRIFQVTYISQNHNTTVKILFLLCHPNIFSCPHMVKPIKKIVGAPCNRSVG